MSNCVMCNKELTEGYGQVCYNCQQINKEKTETETENQNYWEWFNILSLVVFSQTGEKRGNNIISQEQKEKLSNEVLKHLKSKMWQIIQKEGITVTDQNFDWLLERAFKEMCK